MAGGWSAQPRVDDLDDIENWMAQRNADVGLRDQANAFARDLWNQATRDGSDLPAPQSSDLTSIGLAALGGGLPYGDPTSSGLDGSDAVTQRTPDATPQAPDNDNGAPVDPSDTATPGYQIVTARPGDSISRLVGTSRPDAIGQFASLNGLNGSALKAGSSYYVPTSYDDATSNERAAGNRILRSDNARLAAARQAANDAQTDLFAQRLNSGLNVWTGETPTYAPPPPTFAPDQAQPWWDQSKAIKAAGGVAAFAAGVPFGAGRAVVHAVGDLEDALGFTTTLLNPFDDNHDAALAQVADTGRDAVQYARTAISDPGQVMNDVRDAVHQAHVSLDPTAAPISGTLWDEMRHEFGVGANVGEAGANVAATLAGGEIAEGLRGIEAVEATKAAKIAKYLDQGFSQAQAEYLASPYDGMGHHFMPRRTRYPFTDRKITGPLMENRFNVLKPEGMTRGDFYELHFKVDPKYDHSNIPAAHGGGTWNGRELGLEKYGLAGRIWHGSPAPLKGTVGGAGTAVGLGLYDADGTDSDDG
jgi:hypothetical protein